MNKSNFETRIDLVTESEIRPAQPTGTDFSRTMQPLQELMLSEIGAVGGGFSPMWE